MHGVDIAAWGDTLGVGAKELGWAFQARIRQVEEMHGELNQLRASFSDAPDEELVITLTSACRSLAAAGDRLAETLSDLRRTA